MRGDTHNTHKRQFLVGKDGIRSNHYFIHLSLYRTWYKVFLYCCLNWCPMRHERSAESPAVNLLPHSIYANKLLVQIQSYACSYQHGINDNIHSTPLEAYVTSIKHVSTPPASVLLSIKPLLPSTTLFFFSTARTDKVTQL